MLTGCHLVVFGFGQDTQSPKLLIQVLHKHGNPGLDGTEIMVFQFFALGSRSAEQGSAGEPKILTLLVKIPGQQKILLLSTHGGSNSLGLGIAEQPQNPDGLSGHLVHRTKQRGLLVQSLAGIGEEAGGDVQTVVLHKGKGCGIPGGVATGLKGSPQAAGREGAGIGFAPDQFLAGKLQNHPTVPGGGNKGVMLFCGDAGHGLEPVGVVSCTLFRCPNLHGLSNVIGNIQRQGRAGFNAGLPGVENLRRKTLPHG